MSPSQEYFQKYEYRFLKPLGSKIYSFDAGNQLVGLEIEVNRGPISYKITIEPLQDIKTPEDAARKGYASSIDLGAAENTPPHLEVNNVGVCWRFRKAFEDGFYTPFITDASFYEMDNGVLFVRFVASPNAFSEAIQEYEQWLASFSFGTG